MVNSLLLLSWQFKLVRVFPYLFIYLFWFGLVLWHTNHCGSYNIKLFILNIWFLNTLLGITHLSPHNELVHLTLNTKADQKVKSSLLKEQLFTDSVVGSHFSRPCWLRRGSGRVRLGCWIFPTASVAGYFLPPQAITPSGGWVDRPAPEAPSIRGMPTGS